MSTHPTLGHGKICYMEIPADDIQRSAAFYKEVFHWHIRNDNDGNASFDDAVGEVSGTWVTDRKPATEPGLMVSIMVDSVADTLDAIVINGGKIIQAPDPGMHEVFALFADPAGNMMCLYQSKH